MRIPLFLSLAAPVILLVACDRDPDETYQDVVTTDRFVPPVNDAPGQPIATLAELAGEYRLAGIDGEPLDADIGIAVTIEDDRLSFNPACLGNMWMIDMQAGGMILERVPQDDPDTSKLLCTAEMNPVFADLADAIDTVTIAQRTPENAVRLSGGGHSVTLFSQ